MSQLAPYGGLCKKPIEMGLHFYLPWPENIEIKKNTIINCLITTIINMYICRGGKKYQDVTL